MRILLTGATGFIGAHVARALADRGDEVHALTRGGSAETRPAARDDAIEWHHLDPTDRGAVAGAVRAVAPEAAVHLAWYAEPGRYLDAIPENLRSLATTAVLLESLASAGCPRTVLAGSCVEARAPSTIYAAAKKAAHDVAAGLARAGVSTTCAHVFYLYGPGEDPRRVVPTVIRALLRGEPVAVGDGHETRDYLHVSDVASAFCALIDDDLGPSTDICTGRTVRLRDVFEVIGRETGRPELIRYGERQRDDRDFPATGDPTPLTTTGWRPALELEAGIRDAIEYWTAELGCGR
jgi:nucleoside-diphosphate-sugar epimerase